MAPFVSDYPGTTTTATTAATAAATAAAGAQGSAYYTDADINFFSSGTNTERIQAWQIFADIKWATILIRFPEVFECEK